MWSTSGQMRPNSLSSVSSLTGKPEPEETEKAKARNKTRPARPGPRSRLYPAASKSCEVKTQILAPATKCADLGLIRPHGPQLLGWLWYGGLYCPAIPRTL